MCVVGVDYGGGVRDVGELPLKRCVYIYVCGLNVW